MAQFRRAGTGSTNSERGSSPTVKEGSAVVLDLEPSLTVGLRPRSLLDPVPAKHTQITAESLRKQA